MRIRWLILLFICISSVAGVCQSLRGIGFLPGFEHGSTIADVTADGQAVCGTSLIDPGNLQQAFRWTSAGGMQGLGYLPSGANYSSGGALADDHHTVVGQVENSGRQDFAGYWTETSGVFHALAGYTAISASSDGQLICSVSVNGFYLWSPTIGYTHFVQMNAESMSADSLTVVGWHEINSNQTACYWNASTGVNFIGTLPGGTYSNATDVSADGSVLCGWSLSDSQGFQAIRWSASTGMVALNAPANWIGPRATGISGNGSVIVGRYFLTNSDVGWFWSSSLGIFDLKEYLVDHGVVGALEWQSLLPYRASFDGNVIVGTGYRNGRQEGFIATLTVP